jgi:transposase
VNKRFRTCTLDQPFLLPPSLEDWLPENHLARFIADVMGELDLAAFYADYHRKDARGLSAYHPLLMTRLLLYGYCIGISSSRAIERATYDNVAFRYLATNQHPDHATLSGFRRRHLDRLSALFVQALHLCQQAGMVQLGNVSIDGTKILANASTRRSAPHAKLSEREQHWQQVVAQLLAEAEQTDQTEDRQCAQRPAAETLPEQLAHAQSRLERIRQAKAELEREAQRELAAIERQYPPRKRGRPRKQEVPETARPPQASRRRQRAQKNAEAPTRQYNFVDPDSRVMKDNARKCFVQAYNAQIATDSQAQVIVAAELTQQTTDRHQLLPMIEAVRQTAGADPAVVTADAGYWDSATLGDASLAGIELLVAPDSKPPSPVTPLPEHAPQTPAAVRMRALLSSEEGRARYAMRKQTVEPVFGQIKEGRGLRRFRLRGLPQAAAEWKLICATHNLLKLYRRRLPEQPHSPGKARKAGVRRTLRPVPSPSGRWARCRARFHPRYRHRRRLARPMRRERTDFTSTGS